MGKRLAFRLISAAVVAGLAYVAAIVAMNYGIEVRSPHWFVGLISN